MLINLLVWIIVGGIAGWLASLVVQGTGMGIVGDITVGVVGALIGGFVLSLLAPGAFGFAGVNLGSLIIAFIGAVILLFIVRLFTGSRAVSKAGATSAETLKSLRKVVTKASQPPYPHLAGAFVDRDAM